MPTLEKRFSGIQRLYGEEGLEAFRAAHVCVVGIGGVGAWVAEALARSAIGEITLIDMDDLCETNINRQIHALDGTIGQPKVQVMSERLHRINPEILVHTEYAFLSRENTPELIHPDMNCVVDAIDSVKDKAALLAHCKRQKIPVISVGGAGGQIDPTQIAVADLSKTHNDPLAAKVRSFLRRHYGFSKSGKKFGIECVYSKEQLRYPQPDGSVSPEKPDSEQAMALNCDIGLGASTAVTASFGMVAASRALLKIILKSSAV